MSMFSPQQQAPQFPSETVEDDVRQNVASHYLQHLALADAHTQAGRRHTDNINGELEEIAKLQAQMTNLQAQIDKRQERAKNEEAARREREDGVRVEHSRAAGWVVIAHQNGWSLPTLPPGEERPLRRDGAQTPGGGSNPAHDSKGDLLRLPTAQGRIA